MQKPEEVKKKLQDAFKGIVFNEKAHTYRLGTHKFKTSATGIIKNFCNEFDSDRMSAVMANIAKKKNPDTVQTKEWFNSYWEAINHEATSKGKRVHLFGECYPNFPEVKCDEEQGIVDWWKQLPPHYVVISLECRMANKALDLVGTADILLYNTLTGKLVIADYKTNDSNIMLYYNDSKMAKPFSNWNDSSINHYSIQLSIYQLMIETMTDLEVEDRWIIWLFKKDHKIIEKTSDRYKLDGHMPSINAPLFKQFNLPDVSAKIHAWITK